MLTFRVTIRSMKNFIDGMSPGGSTYYGKAMTKAFDIVRNTDASNYTSSG